MVAKIFTLLAVIGVVLLLIRVRSRPARQAFNQAPRPKLANQAAVAVLVVMLGSSAVYAYLAWRDAHQVVELKIIDSRSGQESFYRAYRGDVERRRFRTLDGRLVELAETERLETFIDRQ